jgi:hypothetical protein
MKSRIRKWFDALSGRSVTDEVNDSFTMRLRALIPPKGVPDLLGKVQSKIKVSKREKRPRLVARKKRAG